MTKGMLVILALFIVAYGRVAEKPMMSVSSMTSPLESPVKRYFPTMGKDAKPKPTRNPHYVTPTPKPTAQIIKGVAQPSQYPPDCSMIQAIGATWYYNYLPNPPICPGVESVAMAWDERAIGTPMLGNSEWILGFNEPHRTDQANISYLEAVSLWRQLEQDNPNRKLVAPSAELPWLVDWYNAYTVAYNEPPRIDALSVHFYYTNFGGSQKDAERTLRHQLQTYRRWADKWGVPEIWLTEFARLYHQSGFIQRVLPWLPEECDRYAWFATEYPLGVPWWPNGWPNTSLYHDGVLTPAGEAYKVY